MLTDLPAEKLLSLPVLGGGSVSPTGAYIAYYTNREGSYELYLKNCETAQEQQLTDGELSQEHRPPIMWGSGGEQIYFHKEAEQPLSFDIYTVDLNGAIEKRVSHEGRCIATDESPDGRYLLVLVDQVESPMLARYDLELEELERLTDGDSHVWPAGFSSTGEEIAYQVNDVTNLEDVHVNVANTDGTYF